MSQRQIHWLGSQALLMDLAGLDEALALHAVLQEQPLAGQLDLVPAAQTLLVRFISHFHARQAQTRLAKLSAPTSQQSPGQLHEIPVVYDGPDLADVAAQTGLDESEVIAMHTGQTWQAAFSGFAPGFVYMVGEHDKLHVARRDNPRTAVPAGAVGLAGAFSAIYPRCSPGGWQLIGRTDTRLWDLERDPPALIQAGDRIRYVAVDQLENDPAATPQSTDASNQDAAPQPQSGLLVRATGLQTLVQDLGRPGLSHLGVSQSGAADAAAARQANQQVGNPANTAVLENTLGGLVLQAQGDQILSCTGAPAPAHIDGHSGPRHPPRHTAFILHDGETLQLGAPDIGLRCYIGVRGGLDLPAVLGSRAYDIMAALGPPPLQAGQILAAGQSIKIDHIGQSQPLAMPDDSQAPITLRVIIGPRHDWFDAASQQRFFQQTWRVSQQANRAGLRLARDGQSETAEPPLQRSRHDELASEGMQPGAIQVPPSGLPVIFLKDHPVTGGYPVMACLIATDLARAAQMRPGQRLQFQAVDPQTLAPLPTTQSRPDEASRSCKRS